jgi:hypothetical protein
MAFERISALKEGHDGEEWDWKGRVEVDEDEDEAEEVQKRNAEDGDTAMGDGEGKGKQKNVETGRTWTVQEVATYQRTGRLPS